MRVKSTSWLLAIVAVLTTVETARGACTVLIPDGAAVELKGEVLDNCSAGLMCELDPCTGWIAKPSKTVHVLYRSSKNRSTVTEVAPGGSLRLEDLQSGGLTSAIKRIVTALMGDPAPRSRSGARSARAVPARSGKTPFAQIAVVPGSDLVFSVPNASAGAVFVFHPADASSAQQRVVVGDDKTVVVEGALLGAGLRFRGGLEGEPFVDFQIAPQDKLDRVAAELAEVTGMTRTGAAYRRALVYFDNGLLWNGEQELDSLSVDVAEGE